MDLNQIKRERLLLIEAKAAKKSQKPKILRRLASGKQAYVDAAGRKVESVEPKEIRTPEFVQHCVTAITQDVKWLEDTEDAPLAAEHAPKIQRSTKDYKDALARLRESVEARAAENVDTRSVVFGPPMIGENAFDPHSIQFDPRG